MIALVQFSCDFATTCFEVGIYCTLVDDHVEIYQKVDYVKRKEPREDAVPKLLKQEFYDNLHVVCPKLILATFIE